MNPWLPLMTMATSGGVAYPIFVGANQSYTSANSSSESAIILKTDGKIYELDGVTETERGNWLIPGQRAGTLDLSVYCLSNGMDTGDVIDTWISVGDVERKWGITVIPSRSNTIYFSYGVRSGSTLGSFDHSFTSDVALGP